MEVNRAFAPADSEAKGAILGVELTEEELTLGKIWAGGPTVSPDELLERSLQVRADAQRVADELKSVSEIAHPDVLLSGLALHERKTALADALADLAVEHELGNMLAEFGEQSDNPEDFPS